RHRRCARTASARRAETRREIAKRAQRRAALPPILREMARARSFWVTGPGKGEIREEDLPEPRRDEVLVETLFSAVSRGTEALVWAGRVPASEYQRMRAPHQAGEFPFPVKYGYQSVGRAAGRLVFCLYPHQSRYVVAATEVVPLPDG